LIPPFAFICSTIISTVCFSGVPSGELAPDTANIAPILYGAAATVGEAAGELTGGAVVEAGGLAEGEVVGVDGVGLPQLAAPKTREATRPRTMVDFNNLLMYLLFIPFLILSRWLKLTG